jgi:hypothetical protein
MPVAAIALRMKALLKKPGHCRPGKAPLGGGIRRRVKSTLKMELSLGQSRAVVKQAAQHKK